MITTKILTGRFRVRAVLAWLLITAMLQVSAKGFTQHLTFVKKNTTLKEVFNEINRQTGYSILWSGKNVSYALDADFRNAPVTDVLNKSLAGHQLAYTIEDKTIVIRHKTAPEPDTSPAAPAAIEVRGQVTDAKGAPMPGVTVVLKTDAKTGTVTDANGNFRISVQENSTLVFKILGYKPVEVPVNGQSVLKVTMETTASDLSEVVVVGYGTQKKGDLTGAITSLDASDLTSGGSVSNVAQALQGRAPGVNVTQNSAAPGGSISIRVRGSNSISSSNEPLYVIDGFPTTSGLNINPADIASIEILKDASATAIYGSRGANGVILITTKRGQAGKSLITYNGYVGTQKARVPFTMLSGKEYMLLANDLFREIDGQQDQQYGAYTPSQLQSDVNTNWIDETTQTGVVQNHSIQFQGGNENTKVLGSLGYFNQDGILKNTGFDRFSGRVNIDQRVNDYIKAGASLFAQREKSNYQVYDGNILNSNVLYSILTYDPTVPAYNKDGSFGRPPGGRGDNPLANLLSRKNDAQKDKFNANFYVEVKPLENLTARIDAGTEAINDRLYTYLPRSTYQGSIDNGVATRTRYNQAHHLFDMFLTYDFGRFLGRDHNLSLMGGYAYEKFTNENESIEVYGFSSDLYGYNNIGAASFTRSRSSSKSENLMASFFGRVNYALKDKYLFTFTVRKDGSSRFGSDNRWGTFPSGSFAWRVISEPFMQRQKIFSNMKLRLGYGKTGNERIGDYASYGLVSSTRYTYDGNGNTSATHLNTTSPANSRLKWETTSQYNAGLDLGFLDDRLSLTMDAYYKKTTDLLIKVDLPLYTGYASGQSNVGSVQNQGIELGLTSRNFTGKFTWETSVNLAINRNKVLSLGRQSDILLTSSKPVGNVSEENFAIIKEGEPLGSLFGYIYEGIIQANEKYAPQPNAKAGDPKFRDISGPNGVPDGLITSADRTIIGAAYPKFSFGITNTFSYRNFDLSVFAYGAVGNDLLNMTRMNLEWNRTAEALDRWTPQNQNASLPRNGFYSSKYGGYINSHFIEDASFLRLKNVTLGYTLPLKSKAISNVRLYAVAENLFTITGYSGWDPEVSTKGYENDPLLKYGGNSQTANAGAGLDFNSYPAMRAFTLGLNVNF